MVELNDEGAATKPQDEETAPNEVEDAAPAPAGIPNILPVRYHSLAALECSYPENDPKQMLNRLVEYFPNNVL